MNAVNLRNATFSARAWRPLRVIVFYAALAAVWQAAASWSSWPPYLFPAPADVLRSLRWVAETGMLWEAVAASLQRMLIGYALAVVAGTCCGLAMGVSETVDDTLGSLALGLQSLPSVVWFPLAILWFGLDERAVLFVVFMGSVASIAISARSGVRGIPPLLLRASYVFGGSRWQRLWLVIFPAALPSLTQGLRQGWSFAWRSLLAAELLYVSASLGHLLMMGRDMNDVSLIVAMMLVIVAIGLAADRLVFGTLERAVRQRWGLA